MTHNDFDLVVDILIPILNFIKAHCYEDKEMNNFNTLNNKINELYTTPKQIQDIIDQLKKEK